MRISAAHGQQTAAGQIGDTAQLIVTHINELVTARMESFLS